MPRQRPHRSAYARQPRTETKTPALEARHLGPVRRALRTVLLWLVGRIQGSPVWPHPIAALYALEDRAGRAYVWVTHPESTEEEAAAIAAEFSSAYVRKFNREPRALHIVTPSVGSIQRLTPADAERWVTPWLKAEREDED